jgi:hypothetical protein
LDRVAASARRRRPTVTREVGHRVRLRAVGTRAKFRTLARASGSRRIGEPAAPASEKSPSLAGAAGSRGKRDERCGNQRPRPGRRFERYLLAIPPPGCDAATTGFSRLSNRARDSALRLRADRPGRRLR